MTTHERHMELVDAVNDAKTEQVHDMNYWKLQGWIDGVRFSGGSVDFIAADLAQFERGHENVPMCCGVFNNWRPKT